MNETTGWTAAGTIRPREERQADAQQVQLAPQVTQVA
jgi:hypothetical protein